MAENLFVPENADRTAKYEAILPQIEVLTKNENDIIANMANVAAALRQTFGFFWIGFYTDKGKDLVLSPFQGSLACTRIPYDKGVCGAAFTTKKTIIVPDTDKFTGHIACSSLSKSEIVVPIFKNGTVKAVLDIDSEFLEEFNETDQFYLEKLCGILSDNSLF